MPLRGSVIIPAYNAGPTIQACLKALMCQTAPTSEYEVIVVDDGSTDDTALKAEAIQGMRVIRSAHRGAAAARNRGVQSACGHIVLFTDADCEPTADWVRQMLAPFAEPSIIGAKGTYRTRQRELIGRFVQCEYEEKYARMVGATSIDFVDTYCAAYRRDAFLNSGGFDESFLGASVEDQEFSFRLAEEGARLVFVPTAIVYHRHPATLAAYVRRKIGIGYWKVKVHRRHPAKVWHDSHTPPTEKLQVVLIPAITAALCAAALVPAMGFVTALLASVFVASGLPLVLFVARRDPAVSPVAPLMIVVRAASLAFGLFLGVAAELGRRGPIDAARKISFRPTLR